MIIDTSAIIAILQIEPEKDAFLEAIASAAHPKFGSPNYLEACLKANHGNNFITQFHLDELLDTLDITLIPFTADDAYVARKANQMYGKHSGHAARLNFGDCIAYALAKTYDEPLLYKGKDFQYTDIKSAA